MSRFRNWHLFAICILIWGSTWHVITYQIGHTSPEYGVTLRFALAGAVVLLLCVWRGERLRFALADHAVLALQGGFMYGLAYLSIYHAEQYLPSGVVAVGYSAAPLTNGLGALLLFGTVMTRRFFLGGAMGLAGVALIFWPEFGKAAAGHSILAGIAFTLGALLLSTVGSLSASRNRLRNIPFWPALGWGMLYGAIVSFTLVLLQGQSLTIPSALSWWLSLLYLALAGSVMTFACYLTLLDRLGPAPAGAVGVMVPLLALLVSMLLEGYRPGLISLIGAAFAVGGNILMLKRAAPIVKVPL